MEIDFTAVAVCGMLFIGAPWIFLHYFTQFRRAQITSDRTQAVCARG